MESVSWMAHSTLVKSIRMRVRYRGLIVHPVALAPAGEASATARCSNSVFVVKEAPRVEARALNEYTTGVDVSRSGVREPRPRAIPYRRQTAGCDESSLTGLGRFRGNGSVDRGLACWPLQIDDLVGIALTILERALKTCRRVGEFWMPTLSHVNRRVDTPAVAYPSATPPHASDTLPLPLAKGHASHLLVGALCECLCCALLASPKLNLHVVTASLACVNSHEDVPYARNRRTSCVESDRVPRSR